MSDFMPESGIELLKRAASSCPADPVFAAVAERLRDYLSRAAAGFSLDDAFGLAVGPGGEPWHARERRQRRDGELRALVERFAEPGMSLCERSAWLSVLIHRYGANAWPRDRKATQMPEHYAGNEREYLFRAFTICAVPEGERQLRRILLNSATDASGHQSPDFLSAGS